MVSARPATPVRTEKRYLLYTSGGNGMSRDGNINMDRHRSVASFKRLLQLWPCFVALASMMLVFMSAPAAFAKGGDPVVPFPVVDSRAGQQYAKAMAVDSVGNIIVVGYMNSGSSNDYQVAKCKADGSGLAWPAVSYGTSSDDVATAVAIDSS